MRDERVAAYERKMHNNSVNLCEKEKCESYPKVRGADQAVKERQIRLAKRGVVFKFKRIYIHTYI